MRSCIAWSVNACRLILTPWQSTDCPAFVAAAAERSCLSTHLVRSLAGVGQKQTMSTFLPLKAVGMSCRPLRTTASAVANPVLPVQPFTITGGRGAADATTF